MNKIIITKETKITDALNRLKTSGSRCLVVLDKNDTVIGTLSDGDLRKKLFQQVIQRYYKRCI